MIGLEQLERRPCIAVCIGVQSEHALVAMPQRKADAGLDGVPVAQVQRWNKHGHVVVPCCQGVERNSCIG
ncbi:MAG: hypothetical protein IPG98_00040 [Burkholderiales bacterium]|nr:hypothetical protein [Burkholderiales bacterium]